MASFDEHISQAKQNLAFLGEVNSYSNDKWDWQVTICFYSAVHLMNAHIVAKTNTNYLSHKKVESALNPYGLSPARLDVNTFNSYNKLCILSRRSRYLLQEGFDINNPLQIASSTYSKHMKKAIYHLDAILIYIRDNYPSTFQDINIKCADLKGLTFQNFKIVA